jgi:hypothetical protein
MVDLKREDNSPSKAVRSMTTLSDLDSRWQEALGIERALAEQQMRLAALKTEIALLLAGVTIDPTEPVQPRSMPEPGLPDSVPSQDHDAEEGASGPVVSRGTRLLMFLRDKGGSATTKEIVKYFLGDVKPISVSRHPIDTTITRMHKAGYTERRGDVAGTWYLTDKGLQRLGEEGKTA